MDRFTESVVTLCAKCNQPLPLRQPRNPSDARPWRCANCGTLYLQVVDLLASDDLLLNIRPGDTTLTAQR